VGRPAADDAGPDAARRPGKAPGVFYNTGHGHLGWTLCAATADMVAASIAAARDSVLQRTAPLKLA
jgi:D-amino-acid dehydrogenase